MVNFMNKEPKLDIVAILGAGMIYIGFLLFLIALHILAIETTGDLADVLSTTFTVFVTIYSAAIIYGFVVVIIQLLRWATWLTQTPSWKKEKIRRGVS